MVGGAEWHDTMVAKSNEYEKGKNPIKEEFASEIKANPKTKIKFSKPMEKFLGKTLYGYYIRNVET